MYKGLCKKIGEWANSNKGESVSDLYRAKIRLGEFKAVYSIKTNQCQLRRPVSPCQAALLKKSILLQCLSHFYALA